MKWITVCSTQLHTACTDDHTIMWSLQDVFDCCKSLMFWQSCRKPQGWMHRSPNLLRVFRASQLRLYVCPSGIPSMGKKISEQPRVSNAHQWEQCNNALSIKPFRPQLPWKHSYATTSLTRPCTSCFDQLTSSEKKIAFRKLTLAPTA